MSAGAAQPAFSVTAVSGAGDVVVLAVRGEADIATAPELRAALGEAIDRSPRGVELDLRECSFIDSTALQVIIRAATALAENGGSLSLSRPPEHVRRLFETAGHQRIEGDRRAGGG